MARDAVPRLVAEVRRLRWLVEYGACPTAGATGTEFVLPLEGLMGHELPEYWYGPDDRHRQPVGDPVVDADIDFGTLPVRPAPSRDSPYWTLEE